VPCLAIKRPDGKMAVYKLDGRPPSVTVIGRSQDANVVLGDPSVSRMHAQIWTQDNRWFVKDIQSENGITVEGVPTTDQQALRSGTQLGIGKFRLWFVGDGKDDQLVDGRYVGYLPPWTDMSSGGEDLTFRLTSAEKNRILEANARMDEAVINRLDGAGHWNPGEKKLSFGKAGSIQLKGWFTTGVLAELVWENHYGAHVLTRTKASWAKAKVNGEKLSGTRSLRPDDIFQLGGSRFRYLLPKSSR
jgi:hypothetical protein